MPRKKLSSIVYGRHELFKYMSKMKCSLAAGPDGLPPLFFKKLAKSLAEALSMLYDICFANGHMSDICKHALVTPVFKKGKSSLAENYRPISLTCVACKIFESVIKTRLMELFKENNTLNPSQHGFLEGHSTCTNLLECVNDWTVNLKNGNYTRVAYIDFAKAFDTVSHSKLLHKLNCLGVYGNLLNIIKSFLSNRVQRVIINNSVSEPIAMISGVPQGSVLGPVLFIVYINDLTNIFQDNVTSKFFADDAKLYTEIRTGEDIDNLQFSLDELSSWAQLWQPSISIKKCFTIDLTGSKRTDTFYDNCIDDVSIENVSNARDLGVNMDSSLKFSSHLAQITSAAKQRLYLLFRSFCTKDTKSLLMGYKSYILPLLNYFSQVWSPIYLEISTQSNPFNTFSHGKYLV